MPTSVMDNAFAQAVMGAGLTIVENDVKIPNAGLPFLVRVEGTMSIREPLGVDPLRPWELQKKLQPKISLLHFSLLDCEPCKEEIIWLHQFAQSDKIPSNMQVLQIVYGTNITQLVADEMTPLLPEGGKTHLDLEDGLAERLGVIGAPSTVLIDEAGLVVGYRNGGADFDNPGFDVLVSRVKTWGKLSKTETFHNLTFHQALTLDKVSLPASPTTIFLKSLPVVWILLGIACALCYPRIRSIFRHLRNFWVRPSK